MGDRGGVLMMLALDAALDVALYDRKDDYALAVLDEAWEVAGFAPLSWTDTASGNRKAILDRVAVARRGRHRDKLRTRAAGIVEGFRYLVDAGAVSERELSEARWQRWRARQDAEGSDA